MGCETFMGGGDFEGRKLKQPILVAFSLQFRLIAEGIA